jgi:hypothetical protein
VSPGVIFSRFRILSFPPAVVVLQELMVILKVTSDLVNEITARFEQGDAAEKLVARLVSQATIIERYVARIGDGLTSECQLEIALLLENVQAAVKCGKDWLTQADGPELATLNIQWRICQAYGLSTRNN